MYDTGIRLFLLGILSLGLLGVWIWSKRQAASRGPVGKNSGRSLRVVQKRWIDQKTGVCLVESAGENFLLAYTAGGGVSWQPLQPTASETKPAPLAQIDRELSPDLHFSEAHLR